MTGRASFSAEHAGRPGCERRAYSKRSGKVSFAGPHRGSVFNGGRPSSRGKASPSPNLLRYEDMGKAAEGKERNEQAGDRPKNPLPEQSQPHPGIEKRIEPRPQYEAPNYKGSEKLAGKAAIITGGDSGIGRCVAVLFAREGADVAIVYLAEEQPDADETKQAVEREGRRCLLFPAREACPGPPR